jgi:hypothetical protein
VIVESFRKIVAAAVPKPAARIALLNQMVLPSEIGVELKLVSISLEAVHAPSVTLAEDAEDTVAAAGAAGLSTDDADVSAALETERRALRTFGSRSPVAPTRRPTDKIPMAE